jgi:polyphosphate kinase 2 (PPK2 family)
MLCGTTANMKSSKKLLKLADDFRINHGKSFRLKDYDPTDSRGLDLKDQTDELLKESIALMQDRQEKLYAQQEWAVLLIVQAMDAAGKDGVIKHVMSGLNPQACQVFSFKQPSAEELDHDFLWRTNR